MGTKSQPKTQGKPFPESHVLFPSGYLPDGAEPQAVSQLIVLLMALAIAEQEAGVRAETSPTQDLRSSSFGAPSCNQEQTVLDSHPP